MNFTLNQKERKWKLNYPALGFLIPFAGMVLVMIISGYAPFGDSSILYSDMYHQYFPFFVDFRRALLRGESLLYTWSIGMGMDYLGLISYYLASPLYLLSIFVPESWLIGYFSLLVPVKLGLAGLFFSLFLKGIFEKDDFSISVFGGLYALCAWALGYLWNIMWLDTFALLPLVALGTVRLIREKKFILYTVTLFFSIYANYYIGLFTCIFVFFLFFCYEICRWRGFKEFFKDLCRIALFSALAIGMTAILELPALAALGNTQSSVNKFPKEFRLNMTTDHTIKGLFLVMKKVAGNAGAVIEPTFKEGLPNIYCGIGTLFMAVLGLFSRKVKLREKLCSLFLILFFMLSFIIRQLDYIWHGFHFTNMIPYRFSFLLSFVLLYMAYRTWTIRKHFKPVPVLLSAVITGAILLCNEDPFAAEELRFAGLELDIPVYFLVNALFLTLYTVIFLIGSCHRRLPADADPQAVHDEKVRLSLRRMYLRMAALCVILLELAVNLMNFGICFNGTSLNYYPRGKEDTASMIRYMKEREKYSPFYRTETTHSQTLNDGALNGYYGISTFTSSANVKVTEFMKALGYGAKNTYNRYCFEESSPVSNLFLGLKYMIDRVGRDRTSTWFEEVHHYGKAYLYENNAYLPLGFLAEPTLLNVDFTQKMDPFQFQNQLLSGATGLSDPVFTALTDKDMQVTAQNLTLDSILAEGRVSYSGAGKDAKIRYTLQPQQAGFLCIHLDCPKRNKFSVIVNDKEIYKESISLPQMLAVGDVAPGDVVEILLDVKKDEKSHMTLKAAVLDEQRFRQHYRVLAASTLEITTFKTTFLEGFIDCNRDGLLYTSIPQNGNWQALVDGKPVDTEIVGNAMLAVPLSEGRHILSFRYRNPAFSLGWKISAVCFLVFAFLAYRDLQKRGALPLKGKFRKKRK